jgi:UDP-N-acetyl-2-amino-2-deoxyglucuronate dehydrogenase
MKHNLPIVGRKIRIGIVGCGRISKNHIGSIQNHADELELVAVCDVDPLTLASHQSQYGVPGYRDMAQMLSEQTLDVVALCTPSGIHPEQAILAAKHQVHVITEKPMATRWSDGLQMVKACDEAGVHLFVVKQNRLNSTLQLLKRAVTDKRFGKIKVAAGAAPGSLMVARS